MKVATISAPRLKGWLLLASLLVTVSAARPGYADVQSVGFIEVCYKCAINFGFGAPLDGPTFFIHNTSASSITNGVLKITGGGFTDAFAVGTIAAGTRAIVAPGLSNDRRAGHTFFAPTGVIRDTSELGPNGNDTPFEFTGQQGSTKIDSGVFTPAGTVSESNINFLGGPGNKDEDCSNNCSFDQPVATLIVPSTFSATVQQTLQATQTPFDFGGAIGVPTLMGTVDYNGANIPGNITIKGTINWISDSGRPNDFDFLTLGTQFFGKKCVHQQIKVNGNLFFACLETLYQCSTTPDDPSSFSGANCPPANGQGIKLELEFVNETDDPALIKAPFGLIQGADNAQTCTLRPGCENLVNLNVDITNGGIKIVTKPPNTGHLCILVPYQSP